MNAMLNFMSIFMLSVSSVKNCNYNISGDISDCLYKIPINYVPDFYNSNIVVKFSHKNTEILNNIFNKIEDNSEIIIGQNEFDRYPVRGGIVVDNTKNLLINIKGILDFGACDFSKNVYYSNSNCALKKINYPGFSIFPSKSKVKSMIYVSNFYNLTITSTNKKGKIIGGGDQWYGFLTGAYLGDSMDTKPILLNGRDGTNYLFTMNNLGFYQPPYWTIYLKVDNVHIHNIKVVAHSYEYNKIYENFFNDKKVTNKLLSAIKAFNTDGIDISGNNVYIHDCTIHVGDDCIAVKNGENWLVENIVASGLGMSIGSVGTGVNIVFRNIEMTNTIRGVFVKTNTENVIFENFIIKKALIFPIWIGPAYQGFNNDCPLSWPFVSTKVTSIISYIFFTDLNQISNLCMPSFESYGDIMLRNITVHESVTTPIVIIANNNYKINIEGLIIHKSQDKDFPFSNNGKCYLSNTTESDLSFCNLNSSLNCLETGNKDAIQPCCELYYPYKGGHWGYCDKFK